MYIQIPASITYNVSNKCIWTLYKREKNIDSQLDVSYSGTIIATDFVSTEPTPTSPRDNTFLAGSGFINMGENAFTILVKDVDIEFTAYNYYLIMTSRKSPQGKDLGVIDGQYRVLTTSHNLGLKRDLVIYIVKNI